MAGKFVTRAAERAGVSLETAEHRWKEAKAKVHKGKRRGSWYWGKVMNTFKRMMGLMEAVTLKEWMELEENLDGGIYADWPESIHLYGHYVAIRTAEEINYALYSVEALMGNPTGIDLSVALLNEGKTALTAGYNGDFTQGLGIYTKKEDAGDVRVFKVWATNAVKVLIDDKKIPEARATSAKAKRVAPEWVEFDVAPVSGTWPQERGILWNALDMAFGEAGEWELSDVNQVHRHKWENNLPVTYKHRATAVLDYKMLKASGFKISFLPD